MIIDFKEMPEIVHKNFYGGEKETSFHFYQDDMNKILYGRLVPGASIGFHTHEINSEIVYIVSGSGSVLYEDKVLPLQSGQCHYCPKGKGHSLRNDGAEDMVFFAVVAKQ